MHRPKYKAVPVVYDGFRYASKAEAAYACWLDGEQAKGKISWYLRQPRFSLGCPENAYVADFLVVYSGCVVIDDVKGTETPKFKRDRKLWAKYGPTTLRVVKPVLDYARLDVHGLPFVRRVELESIPGGATRDPRFATSFQERG
jgi:Protein of unknown function (DUF1064)